MSLPLASHALSRIETVAWRLRRNNSSAARDQTAFAATQVPVGQQRPQALQRVVSRPSQTIISVTARARNRISPRYVPNGIDTQSDQRNQREVNRHA